MKQWKAKDTTETEWNNVRTTQRNNEQRTWKFHHQFHCESDESEE